MQRRPRRIGNADVVILEPALISGFLNLLDQFVVERLVGIGLLLKLPVLKGARIQAVPLGLGFCTVFPRICSRSSAWLYCTASFRGDVLARLCQTACCASASCASAFRYSGMIGYR